jgi:hypothetical protein
MANTKQTVFINDDLGIDIQYNPDLSSRQFLLKIIGWDGWHEYRMSSADMLNFVESIADFIFDNSKDTGYNENLTGLARLWHHRRNECIDQLEKYNEQNNSNR